MVALAPLPAWQCVEGDSAAVAVALHAGHELRDEVAGLIAIDEQQRLREEDPYTDHWADRFDTRLVVDRSRFEVDLNRPRADSVYLRPDQAWGMAVWRRSPPPDFVGRSRSIHDAFYATLTDVLERAQRVCGRFLVYDLHTYNHRPGGPAAPVADPCNNPDVNLGTGSMDRRRWGGVVDRFLAELRATELGAAPLDVRENVRFRGGYLCRWVHERFPTTGCALAIEVKKFFMDEHTGQADAPMVEAIGAALVGTVPGVLEEPELT